MVWGAVAVAVVQEEGGARKRYLEKGDREVIKSIKSGKKMSASAPYKGKYVHANVGGQFITIGRSMAEKAMVESNMYNRAG